jgi:predicted lactoylglutathione lyase
MSREIYINLAVKDLEKSKGFFTALGFTFNPKFTDDKAACMIINDRAYVMLLSEPFFRGFTKKEPCDTARSNEVMLALSCASKAEVDQMVRNAIDAGGSHAMDSVDHGFMYGWSFYDLDGHHWEVMWMDPQGVQ